mmetsp:Transcript_18733/g.30731  ORF Transcript_18733/g.30731 Transcript_18733/m.30731 type:complete len:215 (-) Transcript_18733:18-662(-)
MILHQSKCSYFPQKIMMLSYYPAHCMNSIAILLCVCVHLPSLWRSTSHNTPLRRPLRRTQFLHRLLPRPWQLDTQNSFHLDYNLSIRDSLPTFIFTHNLWLFIDFGGQIFLSHFFSHSCLLDGLGERFVDLVEFEFVAFFDFFGVDGGGVGGFVSACTEFLFSGHQPHSLSTSDAHCSFGDGNTSSRCTAYVDGSPVLSGLDIGVGHGCIRCAR